MAEFFLQELKAVMVNENALDNPLNVLKENCLTIQNLSYDCVHTRNNAGEVYGATEPVILEFTVRVNAPHHARQFYTKAMLNEYSDFSVLFNVQWGTNSRMSSYEDGFVANGYVVHLEEDYHSAKSEDGLDQQMLLNVKILVRSLTYFGRDRNLKSAFIQ
ncbi:MAG: hypothetical protein IJ886_02415 [Prevotella sp.]|jgi:hypothetical protein|nr:hypothetical protein [Prevotella sp.]MBR2229112.1 hypothetical protein [Prevotella sp.]MBR3111155.1 hypothetical protein [Prevotella sp.]